MSTAVCRLCGHDPGRPERGRGPVHRGQVTADLLIGGEQPSRPVCLALARHPPQAPPAALLFTPRNSGYPVRRFPEPTSVNVRYLGAAG